MRAARPVQDRQLRQGPRARQPDQRGGRGGQPPPRRRPDLPAGRRRPDQPRRRRRHQPRPRPGPPDQRDRGRARRRGGARARSRRSSSRSTYPTPTRSSRSGPPCSATRTATGGPRSDDPGRPQQHAVVPGGPDATRRGPAAVPPRHRGAARGRRGAGRRPRSTPAARWSATTTVPAFWVLADAHGNKVCVCTADGPASRRRQPLRPPSRILGRLDDGMTRARATDYRGCMRQDLLVRMRRAG